MAGQPHLTKLDELFRPYDSDAAPGAVVGVRYRGDVVYRRGFGVTSLADPTPNTPTTRMRIGSTTKHFCCLGILLLEREGKLDTSLPVRTWLPELRGDCGEPTLLQLMQHTGGLPDPLMCSFLVNGGYYGLIPPGGGVQMMERVTRRNFAPGTRMAYSNIGYTLLTMVTERVSGESWNAFMTQRVFEPLAMRDTLLVPNDLDLVPGMATPHVPHDGNGWRRGIHPDDLLGSGGLVSTVDDLLTWTAHLRSEHKAVGSAEVWSRMFERGSFANGAPSVYGQGLMIDAHRGVRVIHHAGATIGTQCQMLTVPERALDIVVMANRMDAPAQVLAMNVLRAVLDDGELEPEVVPPPATEHPGLVGRWFSRRSRTLIGIEAKPAQPAQAEALALSIYHMPAGVLQRSGAGLAKPDGPSSSLEIRDPPQDGAPACLDVHVCGDRERFERLPATAPSAEDLAPAWCGRYRFADFGKEVEIVLDQGKLVLDLLPPSGMGRWDLVPMADDVAACGAYRTIPSFHIPIGAVLTLDRKDGRVLGFWFDTDRLRNVRFDRC